MRNEARFFYVAFCAAVFLLSQAPFTVWSAEPSGRVAKPRATVAAGFGFQDAESSSITVKTYDAESGEVLSAETYELDIKDDGPPSSHPNARVFAGGVGLGVDGLTEFTLRVYDAANGRFLWEGRLNLGVDSNPDLAIHRVVARVQPRSSAVRTAGQSAARPGQPYFVLRAMNPETGQLMWGDQFTTQGAQVRVEQIGRSIIGMTGAAPRDIDFRIKMPDDSGRRLLWEDKVVQETESEETATKQSDEAPSMLPAWHQDAGEPSQKDAI